MRNPTLIQQVTITDSALVCSIFSWFVSFFSSFFLCLADELQEAINITIGKHKAYVKRAQSFLFHSCPFCVYIFFFSCYLWRQRKKCLGGLGERTAGACQTKRWWKRTAQQDALQKIKTIKEETKCDLQTEIFWIRRSEVVDRAMKQ